MEMIYTVAGWRSAFVLVNVSRALAAPLTLESHKDRVWAITEQVAERPVDRVDHHGVGGAVLREPADLGRVLLDADLHSGKAVTHRDQQDLLRDAIGVGQRGLLGSSLLQLGTVGYPPLQPAHGGHRLSHGYGQDLDEIRRLDLLGVTAAHGRRRVT